VAKEFSEHAVIHFNTSVPQKKGGSWKCTVKCSFTFGMLAVWRRRIWLYPLSSCLRIRPLGFHISKTNHYRILSFSLNKVMIMLLDLEQIKSTCKGIKMHIK
jgi:hypothetical protein